MKTCLNFLELSESDLHFALLLGILVARINAAMCFEDVIMTKVLGWPV